MVASTVCLAYWRGISSMSDQISAANIIEKFIIDQHLEKGDLLPDESDLSARLNYDIEIVRQAVHAVVDKGLVERLEDGSLCVTATPAHDQELFSFTKSASFAKNKLITHIDEAKIRLPLNDLDNPVLTDIEHEAHEALGLGDQDDFIAIVRSRKLNDVPRVIHRAYLRPSDFDKDFLDKHKFDKESLIDVYHQHGFELTHRDTELRARPAYLYEIIDLEMYKRNQVRTSAVLDARQKLYAIDPKSGKEIMLEYLQATYIDWIYKIGNRPTPKPPS